MLFKNSVLCDTRFAENVCAACVIDEIMSTRGIPTNLLAFAMIALKLSFPDWSHVSKFW